MRPVNLIPEDQRRGPGVRRHSGPIPFILVGALVAVLAGVTLVVTTNNQISSEKAELVELESKNTTAEGEVTKLAAYTQLREVNQQRTATVTSLADSRFNWEQVMRELSLILPSNIWLTNLTGTVRPDAPVNGAATVGLRTSIPGPALEFVGCGTSQDAVAGFVSRLRDIDGVTRVGLQFSKLHAAESGEGEEGETVGSGDGCQTKPSIAQFQIVVAFDAAPIAPGSAEEAVAAAAEAEAASASAEETSSETESSETESSSEGE